MLFLGLVFLAALAAVIGIKLWMKSHGADIHPGLAEAELERKVAGEHKLQARISAGRRRRARAMSQFRLGLALGHLAQLRTGQEELRQSVEAFRAALPLFEHEGQRAKWGMTQRNLATSLVHLGRRDLDGRYFQAALSGFEAGLRAFSRDEDRTDRAEVLNSLGALLAAKALRQDGSAGWHEAVGTCRTAVETGRDDRVPVHNARLEINLAYTLACLGERDGDTAALEEAGDIAWAGLEVFLEDKDGLLDPEEQDLYAALCRRTLGHVLRVLGERNEDSGMLRAAVRMLEAVPEVLGAKDRAFYWAMVQKELGHALRLLGERADDGALLVRAAAVCSGGLEVWSRRTFPFYWARIMTQRGATLAALGRLARDAEHLRQAVESHRAALEVFEQAGAPHQTRQARQALARAEAGLAELEGCGD